MYDLIGETDRKGDRDPKHRAEEIIRICDVTGNKKLTKEEVSLSSGPVSCSRRSSLSSSLVARTIQSSVAYSSPTRRTIQDEKDFVEIGRAHV